MTPKAAGTRTSTQAGFVAAVIGLLTAFNLIHLTSEQMAAVLVVGAGLTAFVQRIVEDRLGWGFLRRVPPKRVTRRRRRKAAA